MDDKILFWINDEKLDQLLHEHFSPGYEGDYYTLSELDWEKFQDLAISSGYDFDEDFGEAVKMESRKIYRTTLNEVIKLIKERGIANFDPTDPREIDSAMHQGTRLLVAALKRRIRENLTNYARENNMTKNYVIELYHDTLDGMDEWDIVQTIFEEGGAPKGVSGG